MIARVLRVTVPPRDVDAVLEAYREDVRPIHARAVGLRQHYVLVDRAAGRVEIIGIWDSADDVRAIASALEPARQRLWARFGADPPLEIFEVADELRRADRTEILDSL
jgi:heme-degrading monooxygenase HmoA